jgi:hypothetical protein
MKWILVIWMFGTSQTGTSITHIEFSDLKSCDAAYNAILDRHYDNKFQSASMRAICVPNTTEKK